MTTPPQRLGAYEVIGKLASGGMATTYVARKTGEAGFERLVVLKRVHPHLLFDPSLRDALRDEARLARLDPPPERRDRGGRRRRTQGELCLVMPYVESLSLGELLGRARDAGGSENRRIPAAVASRVLLSVLAGLEAAHEAKDLRGEPLAIVHRDVSPRNVLVGSDGEARLIDFGIAKAKGRMSQTTSGIMKGTLAYMSPEQLRRREIDRRTDVFAAGVVLFEALTGERLFDGRDEADVLIGVLAAEVRPLEGEIEGATSALDDVLSRALERDPDERFPTAAAFSEALERALPPAPAREVAALVERLGAADARGAARGHPGFSGPYGRRANEAEAEAGRGARALANAASGAGARRSRLGRVARGFGRARLRGALAPRGAERGSGDLRGPAAERGGAPRGRDRARSRRAGRHRGAAHGGPLARRARRPAGAALGLAVVGHVDRRGAALRGRHGARALRGGEGHVREPRRSKGARAIALAFGRRKGSSGTKGVPSPAGRATRQSLPMILLLRARAFSRRATRGRAASALAAFVLVPLACTTFDGLEVPPAPEASPGYLALSDGARACSLAARCPLLPEAIARSVGVPASDARFSTCLTWLSGPLPPNRFGLEDQARLLSCVARAPGCAEALACASVEPLAPGDARCAGILGDQCAADGSLVDCESGRVERCVSAYWGAGSECRLGLAGEGRCALIGCLPASAPPPRCTSGVYVRCDAATNLRVATNCRTVGLTCPEGAEGADALCGTADGVFPCDDPGSSSCAPDGERVRVCDGSLASEFDCAAMGGACALEGGGARCARKGEACSPLDPGIDTCLGTELSVCVAGERRTVDCAQMGLSCLPGDGTRSGRCG